MAYDTPRRGGRRVVAIECQVDGVSQRTPLRLSDLSPGGGYVDTPAQVQQGDRINVTFMLEGQQLRWPARIAHVQPTIGFGFAFLTEDLSEEARAALERYFQSSDS